MFSNIEEHVSSLDDDDPHYVYMQSYINNEWYHLSPLSTKNRFLQFRKFDSATPELFMFSLDNVSSNTFTLKSKSNEIVSKFPNLKRNVYGLVESDTPGEFKFELHEEKSKNGPSYSLKTQDGSLAVSKSKSEKNVYLCSFKNTDKVVPLYIERANFKKPVIENIYSPESMQGPKSMQGPEFIEGFEDDNPLIIQRTISNIESNNKSSSAKQLKLSLNDIF